MALIGQIIESLVPLPQDVNVPALNDHAQQLRSLSQQLNDHAQRIQAAVGTATTGNAGPAIAAFQQQASGPAGHAAVLSRAAGDAQRLADATQQHADTVLKWELAVAAAVIAFVAFIYVAPELSISRLSLDGIEIRGTLRSALDRIAQTLGKDTEAAADRGGIRMDMAKKDKPSFSWLPKRQSAEADYTPGRAGDDCDYCGGTGDDPYKDNRTCPGCNGTKKNPN